MRSAHAAGKRAYAKFCQETSEDRYMRDLLFGRHKNGIKVFAELMREDPFSLLNRITGRGRYTIRPDGWVKIGWQQVE